LTNDEFDETSNNSQANKPNKTSNKSEESEAKNQYINKTDLKNIKNSSKVFTRKQPFK
ncbi:11976_t:CDS:1, partial [Gigaspora rosea]